MREEKSLQNKCIRWLKSQPDCWFFKVSGSACQTPGVPDLVICWRGRFVAVELKSSTGKPSEVQLATISKILGAKGIAFVTNSFSEFTDAMENIHG